MKWIAFTIHNNYSDIKYIRFSRTDFSHGQKYIEHFICRHLCQHLHDLSLQNMMQISTKFFWRAIFEDYPFVFI